MWCVKYSQVILVFAYLLTSFPLHAQIIPDRSLGDESSIVTNNATVKDVLADLIKGGAIRENNLFHSFEQFNIPNGGKAYFDNPDGVTNILTRVTGNNISEILGTLGIDGTANLFLLNPNGIVFGENSTLDINGSFLVTTADSYIFANGFAYGAASPETPPLLAVNIPIGLQVGDNPGSIKIQDSGHSIFRQNDLEPFINFDNANGLRLKPEKTLSLVGGEIDLAGANLIAPDGQIQLGSIANGKVNLNNTDSGWLIDYTEVEQFQNINLGQKAFIDVSGQNSGLIHFRGANITLKGSSVISNNHLGIDLVEAIDPNSNIQILIEAEELIEITGVDPDSLTRTAIASYEFGRGEATDIAIKSDNLIIADGGFIGASSFNFGQGGNVTIEVADSIVMNGFTEVSSVLSSSIGTANFADGDAGNLTLDTNRLTVSAGGNIASSVFGTGQGGDIVVNANELIVVEGIDDNTLNPSIISSITFNQGNAGNLTINTAQLIVRDSGTVDSVSVASGNAGSLNLKASESVEVTGIAANSINPSLITSAVFKNPVPILQEIFVLPDTPSGDAGSLNINTPQLKVSDDAQVSVRNDGSGNAGNLRIDANSMLLQTRGGITASTESGNGGNISLVVNDSLKLLDRGLISAEAKEAGDGGNINLQADVITLLDRSSIIANAFAGNGGNIDINTQGLFVSPDSLVSASSEFGLDGTVEITNINGDRPIESSQLSINPIDATQQITTSCEVGNNNFALVGTGGLPENPGQYLRGQTVWQDLRLLKTSINSTKQSSLSIPEYLPKSEVIEAQAWKINQRGNIELVAQTSLKNHPTIIPSNYRCLSKIIN